ncbi:dTDP-glucose 4,6-dehydratase [Streptomyces pseudovenezuelae]|uniref:dTDP-glucose 4,6-dehydratase n=1 Tax=Streptomyces pseudovenezuelae TaxID=67350 RepID=A0ABZ1X692_9ACTN|nr:dTDP-glucose 4,6-dehydratase [Streptomyces pseudovenezuelae]WUA86936.1 dTDP-glucose 4,6-dehydratase [Streptomyces pseudovenezuelae]
MTTTRVLVTGGAGFLGSHYVRMLFGPDGPPDIAVTVLDRSGSAAGPAGLDDIPRSDRFAFVPGDICDRDLVDGLLAAHDQVVHFAAERRAAWSGREAEDLVRTNVLGTEILVDAALRQGPKRFVHISSDEVYGSIRAGSWPETDPLRPNSPRAATKAASDLIALAWHRTHGLDVRVARGSTTYGPRQLPERVVPLFISLLLEGRPVVLRGGGHDVRDWLHVDDHVRGIELVRTLGRPGEVYNIGAGSERSVRELTRVLLRTCDADWGMVGFGADHEVHDRRCSVDFSKIRDELGFAPRRDLVTGLTETVAWYRNHRSWWEPLLRRAERNEGSERMPLRS